MTEEERKEELEPFKNLKPIDPGPEVESDLTSVYAAYGSRETAFPSSYDSRKEGLVTSVKIRIHLEPAGLLGWRQLWKLHFWHRIKELMICQRNTYHTFFKQTE